MLFLSKFWTLVVFSRWKNIFFCFFLAALLLTLTISNVYSIDTPSYQVTSLLRSDVELRSYGAAKWAISSLTDQDATSSVKPLRIFLRDYFRGANAKSLTLARTIPVVTTYVESSNVKLISATTKCNLTMAYYIPKAYQSNPPVPTNPKVSIQTFPSMNVAVIRFTESPTFKTLLTQRDSLIQALGKAAANYDTANIITSSYGFVSERYEIMLRQKTV